MSIRIKRFFAGSLLAFIALFAFSGVASASEQSTQTDSVKATMNDKHEVTFTDLGKGSTIDYGCHDSGYKCYMQQSLSLEPNQSRTVHVDTDKASWQSTVQGRTSRIETITSQVYQDKQDQIVDILIGIGLAVILVLSVIGFILCCVFSDRDNARSRRRKGGYVLPRGDAFPH